MEAKEIRIGNYVYLTAEPHSPEVLEWDIEDYDFYSERLGDIQPIKITEDWLIEFGFSKHSNDYYLLKNGHSTLEITLEQGFNYDYADVRENSHYLTEIKYVHQLQNLCYALYNKELDIN
jgi:hypothetical protein